MYALNDYKVWFQEGELEFYRIVKALSEEQAIQTALRVDAYEIGYDIGDYQPVISRVVKIN